ncbi:MAG: hypothetical protein H7A51_19370 [Akkermansiaceae bacterium]|nr:hypothetical protein [Akkermansiaceae bacterium]
MNKNEEIQIHQIVHKALARSENAAGIRRLVPVAWPILEVEHVIKIRVEEEIGVVERYLIEALARFGPMDAGHMARFMGLEAFVVEAVMKNLQRFPGTISIVDGGYVVPLDTLERLSQGKWSSKIESSEAFFIDGMGGRLLPVSLSKMHRSKWLRVDPKGSAGRITDSTGNEVRNLCWIASTGNMGETSLTEAITTADQKSREMLGVPTGAFGIVPNKSQIKHERWLLALLEVTEGGEVTVRPAFMPSWELANVSAEHRVAFEEVLRRGGESASGILNPDSDKRVASDVKFDWESHIDFSANDGDFVVKLRNPSGLQFWANDEEIDDHEDTAGEELEVGKELPMPASLRTILRFPYWWNPYSCAVRRVVPGDKATAHAMLLLRGMDELRQVSSLAESEEVDLGSWWSEFQERISGDWPAELADCRVTMEKMLSEASRSPDGQVVELVGEYL